MKSEFRLARLAVTLLLVIGLGSVLGFASTASAMSITATPVQLIDGSGDGVVNIMVVDAGIDFNFGFYDGGFQQIISASSIMGTKTFNDGDIVDFAIQSASDASLIYRLSDGNALLEFTNNSASINISWTTDNQDVVVRLNSGDTFAAATAVPEPSAALTFGVCLAVAGWRIRRQA